MQQLAKKEIEEWKECKNEIKKIGDYVVSIDTRLTQLENWKDKVDEKDKETDELLDDLRARVRLQETIIEKKERQDLVCFLKIFLISFLIALVVYIIIIINSNSNIQVEDNG